MTNYNKGWSPRAILASIIVGGALIISLFAMGFRSLPGRMPIATSCSAAISGACHRDESESPNCAFLPLKYGVLPREGPGGKLRVGFSSNTVAPLEDGETYEQPHELARLERTSSEW